MYARACEGDEAAHNHYFAGDIWENARLANISWPRPLCSSIQSKTVQHTQGCIVTMFLPLSLAGTWNVKQDTRLTRHSDNQAQLTAKTIFTECSIYSLYYQKFFWHQHNFQVLALVHTAVFSLCYRANDFLFTMTTLIIIIIFYCLLTHFAAHKIEW